MELSRDAKVLAGIVLLALPTVQYGGLAMLGMLTHGVAGAGAAEAGLNAEQLALFRAGHAHAGVWLILSLVIQVAGCGEIVCWHKMVGAHCGASANAGIEWRIFWVGI